MKVLHSSSTHLFRQHTQWRTPTMSNRRRALPYGRPTPWKERGCGPGESSCPDTMCWRDSSHERNDDRFVRRPSANHPCCTCASSSGSSARRASHGNACHASHDSKSCASHSVCGSDIARRASSPGTSSARIPGNRGTKPSGSSNHSSPERSSDNPPPCHHPPAARVGVPLVPSVAHCTPITPRRYQP